MARIPPWILPVTMTAVVYYPIVHNYFFADDFYNFWYLANEGAARFALLPHAGHSHVTRNVIIAVWYALFGMQPAPYLAFALLNHLLNVYLLFQVAHALTGSSRIAAIVAGLWGIAPAQEQTIGWFAVYGQVLAATCSLWVLWGLARCRAGATIRRVTPWLWGLALIVGILSFAIGLGLALVMPLVAWLLLPPERQRKRIAAILALAAVVGVAVYVGQRRLFEALYGQVLWTVAPQAILAHWLEYAGYLLSLAGYGIVALLVGPWDSATHPAETLSAATLAVVGLLAAVVVWRAPARTTRLLLACALIAVAVYTPIAVGREQFVTATNQAWMVRTPRYQYGGMIAAALAVGVVAAGLRGRKHRPEWINTLAMLACASAAVALRLAVGPPVDHYGAALTETAAVLQNIEATAAAAAPGSDVYITNRPFNAAVAPFHDFPGWAAVFAIFSPDNSFAGHRLRFVVTAPGDLATTHQGRRAPELLCAPPPKDQ